MKNNSNVVVLIALIVALGGLLMGFDASVINGVNKFIKIDFELSDLELGWAVSSLTLTSAIAMMAAGPLSDIFSRKLVLKVAALLYFTSALASAFAPSFTLLVVARMIGGFGVGASLILAPMYIAEISPPKLRGRMVSFNQLNIVIGISLAFISNYIILEVLAKSESSFIASLGFDEYNWRWMLGVEVVPAILYFIGLFFVPRSPRWCILKGKFDEAISTLTKVASKEEAEEQFRLINENLKNEKNKSKPSLGDLFVPSMRLVLIIGVVMAVIQQATGINAVFFYASMIFEQSGFGDASSASAILVGLTNLFFTVVAMLIIDRFGRKPLLLGGLGGIALFMGLLSYGFSKATFNLSPEQFAQMKLMVDKETPFDMTKVQPLVGVAYDHDLAFKAAIKEMLGEQDAVKYESELVKASISLDARLILIGILGFVASFAVSIGPVMWVLFSELFPNRIRGLTISFVGLVNSSVSFLVQQFFPWELSNLGTSTTFLLFGLVAVGGLLFTLFVVPETKGKSLEELEAQLVK